MLNTIILFVIAFVFAIYFLKLVNDIDHKHIDMNNIIIFVICCLALIYAITTDNSSAYHDGYNDAIHDAQLVGIGQDIYQLQFGDDIHEYTFD